MSTPETPAAPVDPFTGPAQDVAALAEENARLRSALAAENARLTAALAASQALASSVSADLTDEDVRRLEHPEEFVKNLTDELDHRITAIENHLHAVGSGSATTPTAPVAPVAPVPAQPPFTANADGTYTSADGQTGTFGPDGFTVQAG